MKDAPRLLFTFAFCLFTFAFILAALRTNAPAPAPGRVSHAKPSQAVVTPVTLRTKLIAVFVALALLPLLALSIAQYLGGNGAVEAVLRERAAARAARMQRGVEHVLSVQESRLLGLSKSEPLRAKGCGSRADVPDTVADLLSAYAREHGEYLQAVTCLDSPGRPAYHLKRPESGSGFVLQTENFVTNQVHYDEHVWQPQDASSPLRSPVSEESYGAALRVTAPVFGAAGGVVAALVAEINLGDVLREADGADADEGPARASVVVVLDNAADVVVYHTSGALNHQAVSTVMPYFSSVASRMEAGGTGFDFYDTPEGGRRLAYFRQAEGLGLSLAATEDYAAAVAPVRRTFLFGLALALAAGLAGLALLHVTAGRETEDIEAVARGASAIAAGDLEQHVEVSATGETRSLAERFNRMSDQLRDLIAREAESRQFQSFLRISAMVSHDLKNAIAGLSMLVSNMEKQFHREEFRADAIESLREATEKLKRTVARLSEPAKSLSGEYRLAARPTDLIPVIRRVLATQAEPSVPLYDIESRLPDTLVATVEPERVENVVENLVINALEAMGAQGGRLTVEAGVLEGDLVFFSVADTGVGMTDAFVKTRLFRPFSTTKNKGIGLGLFTCREVVEAHGGRLDVDSQLGVGTRFRVVLPSRLFNSGERRERPEKVTAAAQGALPGAPE
jgi:signal transduction histidine kinase